MALFHVGLPLRERVRSFVRFLPSVVSLSLWEAGERGFHTNHTAIRALLLYIIAQEVKRGCVRHQSEFLGGLVAAGWRPIALKCVCVFRHVYLLSRTRDTFKHMNNFTSVGK